MNHSLCNVTLYKTKILTSIGIPELTSPTIYVKCLSVCIKAEKRKATKYSTVFKYRKQLIWVKIIKSIYRYWFVLDMEKLRAELAINQVIAATILQHVS